jgi:DNA repair exonuclease SbcCD ATPase subunit
MAGRTRKTVDRAQEATGSVWDLPSAADLRLQLDAIEVAVEQARAELRALAVPSTHAPDDEDAKLRHEHAEAMRRVSELDERNRELVAQLEALTEHPSPAQASAVTAERVVELDERNRELVAQLEALTEHPSPAQASAVTAERVVELERQRNEVQDAYGKAVAEAAEARAELERQLTEERAGADGIVAEHQARIRELEQHLAAAYVAREVPWSDVAAGMMTIARDGTPWMVQFRDEDGGVGLRNGERTFDKNPADGEAVRVLVPYVTPEAAEELVRTELGGRS